MRALALLAAALLASVAPAAVGAAPARPTAKLDTGVVRGLQEGEVLAFRGVPYAAPPVGEGRWRAPAQATAWSGVREAAAYGAACPQDGAHKEPWAQVGAQSEDCLFLNVWRPARPGRYPVMVFIHGGGFTYGAAGVPLYEGAALAKRGVVLVSMNYRLGRLGFFAHPALTRETPNGPLGNYALMDQIAALEWVKRNAAAFGGDPGNVTLFGESAGAGSVQLFMSSPLARGLFHKAVSQSGSGGAPLPLIRGGPISAEAAGRTWAEGLGLKDATPAQLRAIPLAEVIKGRGFPFIDGKVVVASPGAGFREASEMRVPLMIGSNTHEATLPSNNDLGSRAVLGAAYPEIRAGFEAQQAGARTPGVEEMAQQTLSVQASLFVAEMHAKNGAPTYAYSFGQIPVDSRATSKGAGHGDEMEYLFGTQPADHRWDAQDRAVSKLTGDYWTRFARTGDPNGGGAPAWPRVGARPTAVLAIEPTTAVKPSSALEMRARDVALEAVSKRWTTLPPP